MKKQDLQKGLIWGSSEGTRLRFYIIQPGGAASFLIPFAPLNGLGPLDAGDCTKAQKPFKP